MKHYKSLFISDCHIGSSKCNADKLYSFLKSCQYANLFIIGDLFHGDKKQYVWPPKLMKLLLYLKCPVVYVLGNHDDFLSRFDRFPIDNWYICKDYIYESNGRRYLLDHGHSYHYLSDYSPEVKYHIGSKVYKKALLIGAFVNLLCRPFKFKLINNINKLFFRGFRSFMLHKTKSIGCNALVTGHIHLPMLTKHYMNCGDWIDSNTAIAENFDGSFELLKYDKEIQVLQHLRI
jgi:UDP-2,3-diacylglucosamine pyrophosphatase LpxH